MLDSQGDSSRWAIDFADKAEYEKFIKLGQVSGFNLSKIPFDEDSGQTLIQLSSHPSLSNLKIYNTDEHLDVEYFLDALILGYPESSLANRVLDGAYYYATKCGLLFKLADTYWVEWNHIPLDKLAVVASLEDQMKYKTIDSKTVAILNKNRISDANYIDKASDECYIESEHNVPFIYRDGAWCVCNPMETMNYKRLKSENLLAKFMVC